MTDLSTARIVAHFSKGDMAAIARGLRTVAAATSETDAVRLGVRPSDARRVARAIEASLGLQFAPTRIVEVPVEQPLSRSAVLFFVVMLGLQAFGTLGDIALAIVQALQ
ncbi:MAG: hypothetical protein V4712_15160 [Pseudomonadota bacterium]